MNLPTVSVVITCFNYGRYLEGCLRSVLEQTFGQLEAIVVNDGSEDDTDQVMARFAGEARVRYISQKNAGQANAKNTGIRNASGSFIAFLDADDWWERDKLEKQMPLFAREEVGVVYSRARYVGEFGEKLDFGVEGRHLTPREGKVTEQLIFDNFVPFSSAVVLKDALQRFGGFDERFAMGIDWDLWLRISTGYDFDFVDEPLLVYRLGHAGQMSRNLVRRQECTDRIMTSFLERYPGTVPERVLKRALAYTHCNRGYYYSRIDRGVSNDHYLRSLRHDPLQIGAYKGLLKNALGL